MATPQTGGTSSSSVDTLYAATEETSGTLINGNPAYCVQAEERQIKPKAEKKRYCRYHGRNIVIKNLKANVDEKQLASEFAKFGKISSTKVMRDENGRSKRYGFLRFSTHEGAKRAVTDMKGCVSILASKPLYVAFPQKKDRAAHLAAIQKQQSVPSTTCSPPALVGEQPCQLQTQQQLSRRGQYNSSSISSSDNKSHQC